MEDVTLALLSYVKNNTVECGIPDQEGKEAR
jgi:hypothetical protein